MWKSIEDFLTCPLAHAPAAKAEADRWLAHSDLLGYLNTLQQARWIPLYANRGGVFLYAITISTALLEQIYADDLLRWQCSPNSAWCAETNPDVPGMRHPLANAESELVKRGEPLIYARNFARRTPPTYFELSEKLTHLLGIHRFGPHDSYCVIDTSGDVQEIARFTVDGQDAAAFIDAAALRSFLEETANSLVILFDSVRHIDEDSIAFPFQMVSSDHFDEASGLYYRARIKAGDASHLRGCRVIHLNSWQDATAQHGFVATTAPTYSTFVALDYRHKTVREVSCDPTQLGNDFVDSEYPARMSPVFFKPEVLLRYKADPDKFVLKSHSVTCRGAWHLRRFDTNDIGLVHVYLGDLRALPYNEQIYWKSFNVSPRGGLGARTRRDFGDQNARPENRLEDLKEVLRDWEINKVAWWQLRNTFLPNRVHQLATTGTEEWAAEILNLDQLLVEGFDQSHLRTSVKAFGTFDPSWMSLRLLQELLLRRELDSSDVDQILGPMKELHHLRNVAKGHATGTAKAEKITDLTIRYGDLRAHFRSLVEGCANSVERLDELGAAGLLQANRASDR